MAAMDFSLVSSQAFMGAAQAHWEHQHTGTAKEKKAISPELEECGVCLEGIKPGQRETRIKCHAFCKACIEQWAVQLRAQNRNFHCPTCRKPSSAAVTEQLAIGATKWDAYKKVAARAFKRFLRDCADVHFPGWHLVRKYLEVSD